MAISYVQTGTGVQNFSVDSFVTASVGTTTTGNFMVVAVEVGTLSEITNVQDNKGNSYSLADSVNDSLRIYYAPITSGGAGHTVTANLNTNLDLAHITAEEWTGLSALGELDRTQHNTGSSNTWDTGTTAATRTPNQLVWAVSQGLGAFRTITAGAGYTHLTNNDDTIYTESKVVSSTGTQDATFGSSISGSYAAIIATFSDTNATTTTSTSSTSSSTSSSISTSSTSSSSSTSISSTSSSISSTSSSRSTTSSSTSVSSVSTSSTSSSISTSSTSSTSSSTSVSSSTSSTSSSTSHSTSTTTLAMDLHLPRLFIRIDKGIFKK